jgi:tRNA-specific 2-thiouridylase
MDSTASALILKEQGHDVAGVHMRLHLHEDGSLQAAQRAAHELGIPLYQVDLSRDFQEHVVRFFIEEYTRARTPSPCPLCNRFIKTTLLFQYVRSLGYEQLATGHYARIRGTREAPTLMRGADRSKDQSYFLCMLSRESLSRTLFPVGEHTKKHVRDLLRERGISAWRSAESQELCFVPQGDYRAFLESHGVDDLPGNIVDSSGKVLGRHKGITGYTVGQRRGLGIAAAHPLYVLKLDPGSHTVVVGTKEETMVSLFAASDWNFLVDVPPAVGDRFEVKVRSTSAPAPCSVAALDDNSLTIRLDRPQSGVAPGQAAVLYSGSQVVGGGWIA